MSNTATTPARAIPERPALAPWYRLIAVDGRLLLEHGGSVITFEGKAASLLLPSLIPLLDGSRTVDEIVDAIGATVAPATHRALTLMADKGALLDGRQPSTADGPASEAAIFTAATGGPTPAQAFESLSAGEVSVAGTSSTAEEIVRILEATGLRLVRTVGMHEAGDVDGLLVAAPNEEERAQLASVNTRRLELVQPWLQIVPNDGRFVVIGPLFVPASSACHTCYRIRRGACSGVENDFDAIDGGGLRAASPHPLVAVAGGIAAVLALRWLAWADPTLPGRFYVLETGVVLGLGYHQVLRVPRCPSCGIGSAPMPTPWFNEKARGG
jgi:bacteriocin biosynthesis cyclodehydratase domain-containing protein